MANSLWKEIIVDNFAGGGGASTGIEMATGNSVAVPCVQFVISGIARELKKEVEEDEEDERG